jgi:hypothetical protein
VHATAIACFALGGWSGVSVAPGASAVFKAPPGCMPMPAAVFLASPRATNPLFAIMRPLSSRPENCLTVFVRKVVIFALCVLVKGLVRSLYGHVRVICTGECSTVEPSGAKCKTCNLQNNE